MKNLFGILLASVFLYACSPEDTTSTTTNNTIRVGTMSGPETAIMETVAQVAQEKYGLSIQIVEFTDYLIPNTALINGDIDANAMQHKPFLDKFIENRKLSPDDLHIIGNTLLFPIRAYSQKITSLEQLTSGSTIAIPDDPSNKGRALCLLAANDIIELDNNISCDEVEIYNITNNTLNVKIIELEGPSLPRVLDDVALAVINNTFSDAPAVRNANVILEEDKNSPYVNLIVARADNYNNPQLILLVKAFQSDEVADKAYELFGDQAVPGWE